MFSSKGLSIMALLATVCFLALIGLQVAEWMYYAGAPSVWPAS